MPSLLVCLSRPELINFYSAGRCLRKAVQISLDFSSHYVYQEWHCTIRGPAGTEFEGGIYHLRILLPAEYPFRPPSLMLLTPNGRFELNTKVCHEQLVDLVEFSPPHTRYVSALRIVRTLGFVSGHNLSITARSRGNVATRMGNPNGYVKIFLVLAYCLKHPSTISHSRSPRILSLERASSCRCRFH
jgi:hypothetical protein